MSNSLIIKCSNEEAISQNLIANSNGDWTTTIQEKILIEEGDTIVCRNAFIDTRSTNSQKIIIEPPGITCNMEFIKYYTNWRGGFNLITSTGIDHPNPEITCNVDTVNSTVIPYSPQQNVNVAQVDCERYISCNKKTLSGEFKFINTLVYRGIDFLNSSGGFFVFIRYVDEEGTTKQDLVSLITTDNGTGGKDGFQENINIVYDTTKIPEPANGQTLPIEVYLAGTDGFGGEPNFSYGRIDGNNRVVIPGGPDGLGRTKIDGLNGTGRPLDGDTFTPVKKPFTFDIDGGNYDPEDLVEEMNRKLQQITGAMGRNNLAGDNPFLSQVGGVGADDPENNFVRFEEGINQNVYGFQINTATPTSTRDFRQFIGANQVSLGYNQSTEQFFFEFLHFPLYTSSNMEGIQIVNRLINPVNPFPTSENAGGVNNNETLIVNNFSGIGFTKLNSVIKGTNIPTNFWNETLGFDTQLRTAEGNISPTCCLVNYEVRGKDNAGNILSINQNPSNIPIFLTTLVDGVNIVGAYKGIDAVVDKTDGDKAYSPALKVVPDFPTGAVSNQSQAISANFPVDSDKTTPIEATTGILASKKKLDFGYFLVEVKAQFNNNFISPNENKKDIVAIVSRYYELGSFTSSSQSDSVVYTHKGEPQLLTSFNCRILNSSVEPALNLGKDNTVFLEVIKAQKPQIDEKKK